jgi:hypothetical protein
MAEENVFTHDNGNNFAGHLSNNFRQDEPSYGGTPCRWNDQGSNGGCDWEDQDATHWFPLNQQISEILTDGIVFGDTHNTAWMETLTDGVAFGDLLDPLVKYLCECADGVTFGDSNDPILQYFVELVDGIKLGDTVDPLVTFYVELEDGVTLSDSTVAAFTEYLTDGIKFQDFPSYLRPKRDLTIFAEAEEIMVFFDAESIDKSFAVDQGLPTPHDIKDVIKEFKAKKINIHFSALPITLSFKADKKDFDNESGN